MTFITKEDIISLAHKYPGDLNERHVVFNMDGLNEFVNEAIKFYIENNLSTFCNSDYAKEIRARGAE